MVDEVAAAFSAGKLAPAIKVLDPQLSRLAPDDPSSSLFLLDRAACNEQMGLNRKALKVVVLTHLFCLTLEMYAPGIHRLFHHIGAASWILSVATLTPCPVSLHLRTKATRERSQHTFILKSRARPRLVCAARLADLLVHSARCWHESPAARVPRHQVVARASSLSVWSRLQDYEEVLRRSPTNIASTIGKGRVLSSLGKRQASYGHHCTAVTRQLGRTPVFLQSSGGG